MQAFLTAQEKVIYIAYGTYFYPSEEDIDEFTLFAEENKDYQVLIAMNTTKVSDVSKERINRLPNLEMHSWVPQLELLNSGLVDVFISHGGVHSLYESLHARVPLIVNPVMISD